ncbi:MAG: hypothetical protein WAM60_20715 [Candidatus Promineifilaceae bacterium]
MSDGVKLLTFWWPIFAAVVPGMRVCLIWSGELVLAAGLYLFLYLLNNGWGAVSASAALPVVRGQRGMSL